MANTPDTEIRGFEDEPRKPFKIPKWASVTACIFALILAIALIIPSFLDQERYKQLIIAKVEESTGYNVSWKGDIGISLLPVPHVKVEEAIVSAGSQRIVAVKQAEVSVALMPLLSKKIQINSVDLIEPDISLVVDASGRQTWMTDKLNQQKEKDAAAVESGSEAEKAKQEITLDNLNVENGHFIYDDRSKASRHEIAALNADIDLGTMSGPFKLDTDFIYNGQKIAVEGDAGELIEGKPTQIDVDIAMSDLNVKGAYKGEIVTGDAIAIKGDLNLTAEDLEKTLTAFSKSESKLPEGMNGALDLSTALVYDGDTASLSNLKASLGQLSYEGEVKVESLKTSSAPQLRIDLESTAENVRATTALVKILSDLSVKGTGTFVDNVATINNGVIGFEGQTVNLSGSYALPKDSKSRARLNAMIKADRIDFDDLSAQLNPATESAAQKASNAKKNANSKSAISGMSLPFDGNIKGSIGSLAVGGKTYSNLNFDVTANGNALTIGNLALNAVSDTAVNASGTISDLSKLSGFDVKASIRTGNVEGLAKAYNIPLKLEQTLGAASLNGTFKGSAESLSFNATIDALSFAVTGIGSVQSVMSNPVIETLNLRVRHPSLQAAVRNFSPGFNAPGNLAGPFDMSTKIALAEKSYTLSDIKGMLGGVSVAGNLKADMNGVKPSLTGAMNFGSLQFDSPAPKAGSVSSGGGNSSSASGGGDSRWSREAIDTSWMEKFNADLSVNANSIQQGLFRLTNAKLAFKLTDGNLNISNLEAGGFGGKININGGMKAATSRSPLEMNWSAKAMTINAQQLLSALQNKQSDTLSGIINNFSVDLSSAGASPAALIYALSGKGSADGKNLIIKGVDAAKLAEAARGSYKPLERAGSLFASFKDGQTSFTDLNAAFTITNGVVNFSAINFDGPQATLKSTGNVNLPRWTIDLKNNMTVKNSDLPPFDFAITGPLDNPAQTGGSVIEGILRDKIKDKITEKYGDKINEKLNEIGLPGLLGAPKKTENVQPVAPQPVTPQTETPASETQPAADTAPPAEPVKKTKEQEKAEQIEQGVKALQGLFGQ